MPNLVHGTHCDRVFSCEKDYNRELQ